MAEPTSETPAEAKPKRSAPTSDPRSVRRLELKRQKRRAHRRRINASNRPG